MRISPTRIIHSEEMYLAEEIEGSDLKRHFIVQLDQTYNEPLRVIAKQRNMLDATVLRYRDHFEKMNGEITDIFNIAPHGYQGKEIWVEVPGKEKLSIRTRIFIDEITKIQQMVIAPADHTLSGPTAQFFGQMRLYTSKKQEPGEIEEDWKEYPLDVNGYFTFLLPDKVPPYLSRDPEIEVSGVRRSRSFTFFDPVYHEYLLFNAYVYDFGDESIRNAGFIDFVEKNHVKSTTGKQLPMTAGDFRGMRYWVPITPPPGKAEVNYKLVKAYYINNFYDRNYIIVSETMASERNIRRSYFEDLVSNSFNIERKAKAEGYYVGDSDID